MRLKYNKFFYIRNLMIEDVYKKTDFSIRKGMWVDELKKNLNF